MRDLGRCSFPAPRVPWYPNSAFVINFWQGYWGQNHVSSNALGIACDFVSVNVVWGWSVLATGGVVHWVFHVVSSEWPALHSFGHVPGCCCWWNYTSGTLQNKWGRTRALCKRHLVAVGKYALALLITAWPAKLFLRTFSTGCDQLRSCDSKVLHWLLEVNLFRFEVDPYWICLSSCLGPSTESFQCSSLNH